MKTIGERIAERFAIFYNDYDRSLDVTALAKLIDDELARCQHFSTDICTGPKGDPRVGKRICNDCGELVQQPSGLVDRLESIRTLLYDCPIDCLGIGTDSYGLTWPTRDEVIDSINKTLHNDSLAQPSKVYLTCVKCKQGALRFSSTIDGLRCQSCGAAYLNCEQVDAREKHLLAQQPMRVNAQACAKKVNDLALKCFNARFSYKDLLVIIESCFEPSEADVYLDWLDQNDASDALEDFLNNATPIREAIAKARGLSTEKK